MRFKQIIVILCAVFFFSGCAKLAHLQQLLTLKRMSENKDEQEKFVKQQDASFEKIMQAFREDRLGEYPDAASVEKEFGSPIYVGREIRDGVTLAKWLYRYSVQMLKSDKLYLFFSPDGKLLDWKYVEKPPESAQSETPQSP